MNVLLADLHKFVRYSGGIEHVLSRMAFALADGGFHVSVVMADEKVGEPFYAFPGGVYNLFHLEGEPAVHAGGLGKLKREILRAFSKEAAREQNYRMLAKAAPQMQKVLEREQPDVIISFREPTGRLLLEGLGTKIPVISMLHNDPDEIFAHSPAAEKAALTKSAAIQVLMPSFIQKAENYLDYHHFVHIPNAVEIPDIHVDVGQPRKVHTITNVGRITGRTKRQHLLVEAFASIAQDYPDWRVELWGDTYDKAYVASLKTLIKKHGLTKQVKLCGTTKDMASVWHHTDIFAFPSHHEGFPLALSEAMGVGIPAVGYETCPSVNELIHDGENGFLVKDGAEPFAAALRQLMDSADLRRKLGAGARASMEPYRPEVVWGEWKELILKVAGKGS